MAELNCPNCGPAGQTHAKSDGTVVCETCGGSFVFRAGEPKLSDVGQLDRLAADVEDLKRRTANLPPGGPPAPPAPESEDPPDPEILDEHEEDL